MIREGKIAALILAAGYSSRMQSFKPLLPLGAQTVVEYLIRQYRRAGIEDICVVTGFNAEQMEPVLASCQTKSIFNPDFSQGMYSSICAGVRGLAPDVAAFFVAPVDVALVQVSTLIRLQTAYQRGTQGIISPVFHARRGHPPLISSRYQEDLLQGSGEGGLRAFLRQHEDDTLNLQLEDANILLDMDTQEDYRRIVERFEKGGEKNHEE